MIHLEPAFSVTNEAIMELVRISETAVSVSGTNMWRPHGYVPKSSRQYRELTVERRRVGDNLSRLVFASQHLFIECVRYHLPNCVLYLPPFKNLFDIQIEISGFIRLHADRVPSFGYFRGRNARSRSIARMNPFSVSV